MVELNVEEMSLPVIFDKARKIHLATTEASVDQDTIRVACDLFRKCEDMVGKLGLFSRNESKDDITTTNLKYLLVPYYLGELMEKISEEDRIEILIASRAKLKEFISFCETMELVPEFELESCVQASITSADRRAKKIARFKRQKAAESKLLELKERKERRGRSSRASVMSTTADAGEEDMGDDDGEEEREAWLTTISLAMCKAFDLLEMLKKEEEMLSAVKELQEKYQDNELSRSMLDDRAKKAEAWHRDAATRGRYSKPAAPITCATFAQDVLEGRAKVSEYHEHKHQPMIFGPASLVSRNPTSEREKIAAQVFQPHYRLPTMSIEEAGLKEMEIMNKWQERNAKMLEEANSSWHTDRKETRTEEEDEEDDAAQAKARAWDDWKDENPRGAGNKKLTPCG